MGGAGVGGRRGAIASVPFSVPFLWSIPFLVKFAVNRDPIGRFARPSHPSPLPSRKTVPRTHRPVAIISTVLYSCAGVRCGCSFACSLIAHCPILAPLSPLTHVGEGVVVRGGSGRGGRRRRRRRHDAFVHRLRGPRGPDRGAVLQAVPQDDGPHDLGGAGAGAAVDPFRDAARRERGGPGNRGVTGMIRWCFGV